jgi:glycosyltransferase involved in cell wall biosynthesis
MRVLTICPLATVAGGEVMWLRLAPELVARHWDARTTVPGRGELEDRLRREGLPVARLPLGPPAARRKPLAALAGVVRAARASGSADVVLLNGLSTQRVLHALRLRRRPAVLHVNNPILGGVAAWSRPWTWSVVRAVITDTEASADECIAAGAPADRVHPLNPPAWSGVIPPSAARLDGPGRVGYVGRLEPRKGVEDLIVAARRFLRGRPKASVTIIGARSESAPPGYEASLRAAARASGVMDRIEFAGWRTDGDAAVAEFDVLCLPSRSEPYGTVAAEAAARGVPVVATRVGGVPEVVLDGETGSLVPPGDPPALAEAIARLVDDRALRGRMGGRARERALERFAPGPYADRVDAVLRAAVGP